MSTIGIESHKDVALLRLHSGVTNAINEEMVADLSEALADIRSNFRGLVLAGGDKFFSIGLDLPHLLKRNREGMDAFWQRFDQVLLDLFTLPVPSAAAINGHAVAGGTILALACVYRFIGDSRNLMGLNEVNIGVPVPYLADLMLRQVVDEHAANQMVFGGEMIVPETAARIGLVNQIVTEESLENHAIDFIAALASKPRQAMALIIESRTEQVVRRFARNREAKRDAMMRCWFRPQVQQMLAEAAKKF